MSSTLPKSVQAAMGGQQGNSSSATTSNLPEADIKSFIQKIRNLPEDFLRLPEARHRTVANDQAPHVATPSRSHSMQNMLDISVVEAILVKNYGLLRMDLYAKIRVGHMVCETQTCPNGAKNPKWEGIYQFNLKPGINSFHIEIYDEKQFSPDEKIAWLYQEIPAEVYTGMTVERWYPLSGRLGPGKEGSILVVMSLKRVPFVRNAPNYPLSVEGLIHSHVGPLTIGGTGLHQPGPQIPIYVQPNDPPISAPDQTQVPIQPMPQQPQAIEPQSSEPIPITEEDIIQLSEMFPSIDKAIIKAVLENNQGNKEAAITFLLTLG